jgi:hypothetical protein
MNPLMKSLGIEDMAKEDRLQLIGELWDSLTPIENDLLADHQTIIEERLQTAKLRPEARVRWEDALARLQSKS